MQGAHAVEARPARDAKAAASRTKAKDLRIESLRGLALVLMVAGHVIGNTPDTGMRVDDSSIYRHFYFSLSYLRMPLFTAISGFVYAMAPASSGSMGRFFVGKARRLLLPFATVMTAQFLMRMATPGVNARPSLADLPRAYLYGFDQFWFLQAAFCIFIVVGLLDSLGGLGTFQRWATATAVALAASSLSHLAPALFSLNSALRLLPFFLLGYGVRRYPEKLFHPASLAVASVALAVGVVAQQAAWFSWIPMETMQAWMVPAIVGLAGNLLLLRFFTVVPILAFFGAHAYTVYLLHVFFTASSRLVLNKLGIGGFTALVFAVGLTAGVVMPIFAERLIVKSKLLRRAALGLR